MGSFLPELSIDGLGRRFIARSLVKPISRFAKAKGESVFKIQLSGEGSRVMQLSGF